MTGRMNVMGKRAFNANFGDSFGQQMGLFDGAKFLEILKAAKRDQKYHETGRSNGELAAAIFAKIRAEPTDWLTGIAKSFQDLNSEIKILAEKNDLLRLSLYRVNALINRCNKVIFSNL